MSSPRSVGDKPVLCDRAEHRAAATTPLLSLFCSPRHQQLGGIGQVPNQQEVDGTGRVPN
ncbi:MAG: hypothetical protein RBU37_20330 [Myxococcota bacterium]|nr:hypothetical protein [Myxococcota bacterium]